MSKKITPKTTRTSAKQQFEAYKDRARTFINSILYPVTKPIFSIAAYTPAPEKKPNAMSVPELVAIVGTAQKLGKKVQVSITNINELTFSFVDQPNFPSEL